jgi:large subunit ribosomal protein L25
MTMDSIALEVQKREVLGNKNKALRRSGVTPAHLFGHGVKSQPLQGATAELEGVVRQAGTSRLIGLKVSGEKRARNVLVREVQRQPGTGLLLHVDFYQVRTKERMTVEVPVHVVGDAPVLQSKANSLVIDIPHLHIECLPSRIPSRIDIDVSELTETDDVVRVHDVKTAEGIVVLNDPELVVVKVEVQRGLPAAPVEGAAEGALAAEEKQPEQAGETAE